jgi:hypothetical protein
VTVRVKPVRLPFLRLSISRKAPPRARRIVIRARSAVPALLTVNGSRHKLGKKSRKLHVAIRPRRRSWLHLEVTAGGVRTAFAALVRRAGGSVG